MLLICYSQNPLSHGLLPFRALRFCATVAGQAVRTSKSATMKNCAKCKSVRSKSEFHRSKKSKDGLQSYCKPCCAEHVKRQLGNPTQASSGYFKNYFKTYARPRTWEKKNPLKIKAQNKLNHEIFFGRIIRSSHCSNCGVTGKIQGHHADYSKPLDVMWLCQKCHIAEHKKTLARKA